MSLYSWDQRIRRAEQLADDCPASREILRFYAQLARFQEGVYERLNCDAVGTTASEALEPDFSCLLRLIQRIGPAPLAGKAGELERENRSFRDLLAIDGPEPLFFVRVLLQPLMECAAGRNSYIGEDGGARCPFCGEWPQTALLRGEGDGGKRWLMCSLCSTEWEFRRILCPKCGEENHDRLPVYTSPAFEHVRVEACDCCHAYIKSIDLTKNGLAIPCVDELASLPLDLWADQAGYAKLQLNIIGL